MTVKPSGGPVGADVEKQYIYSQVLLVGMKVHLYHAHVWCMSQGPSSNEEWCGHTDIADLEAWIRLSKLIYHKW